MGERKDEMERGGGGGERLDVGEEFQIQIQNNFIDTVHIINTYWVISSIKFNR